MDKATTMHLYNLMLLSDSILVSVTCNGMSPSPILDILVIQQVICRADFQVGYESREK